MEMAQKWVPGEREEQMRVGDTFGVGLQAQILSAAAEWYSQPVPPPIFATVNPAVLKRALKLSDGVWGRLIVESPDVVIVCNRVMWS